MIPTQDFFFFRFHSVWVCPCVKACLCTCEGTCYVSQLLMCVSTCEGLSLILGIILYCCSSTSFAEAGTRTVCGVSSHDGLLGRELPCLRLPPRLGLTYGSCLSTPSIPLNSGALNSWSLCLADKHLAAEPSPQPKAHTSILLTQSLRSTQVWV